jgi:hypothetical protein
MRKEDLSIGSNFDPSQFSLDSTYKIHYFCLNLYLAEIWTAFRTFLPRQESTLIASSVTVLYHLCLCKISCILANVT